MRLPRLVVSGNVRLPELALRTCHGNVSAGAHSEMRPRGFAAGANGQWNPCLTAAKCHRRRASGVKRPEIQLRSACGKLQLNLLWCPQKPAELQQEEHCWTPLPLASGLRVWVSPLLSGMLSPKPNRHSHRPFVFGLGRFAFSHLTTVEHGTGHIFLAKPTRAHSVTSL